MTAVSRLRQIVDNDDKLKNFAVGFQRSPMTFDKVVGTINVQCNFEFDQDEVDRLTDHGLKCNIEHKVKLAMRSILSKTMTDLEKLV